MTAEEHDELNRLVDLAVAAFQAGDRPAERMAYAQRMLLMGRLGLKYPELRQGDMGTLSAQPDR